MLYDLWLFAAIFFAGFYFPAVSNDIHKDNSAGNVFLAVTVYLLLVLWWPVAYPLATYLVIRKRRLARQQAQQEQSNDRN